MKWNEKLRKAPSRAKEPWTSNEQVQAAWEEHVRKRGAKNTQRNHITYLRLLPQLRRPRLYLDAELVVWIRRYRAWWEDHVERRPDGQPA